MNIVIAVIVGVVVGACLVRVSYMQGRRHERQLWRRRGHSIWDQEQR